MRQPARLAAAAAAAFARSRSRIVCNFLQSFTTDIACGQGLRPRELHCAPQGDPGSSFLPSILPSRRLHLRSFLGSQDGEENREEALEKLRGLVDGWVLEGEAEGFGEHVEQRLACSFRLLDDWNLEDWQDPNPELVRDGTRALLQAFSGQEVAKRKSEPPKAHVKKVVGMDKDLSTSVLVELSEATSFTKLKSDVINKLFTLSKDDKSRFFPEGLPNSFIKEFDISCTGTVLIRSQFMKVVNHLTKMMEKTSSKNEPVDVVIGEKEMSSIEPLAYTAVRFVPGWKLRLVWRTPWTYATFGRAYGSAAESREREVRVSDEGDHEADEEADEDDAEEPSEFEDDYDVEDEQSIEDSDDHAEGEEVLQPTTKKEKFKPPKPKLPEQEGRRLNENITATFLRLVSEDGKSHGVVSRHEALTLAKAKKLDLVQVDGSADPPVCKIFDFHKEEYRQVQILKDRKKKKGAMTHLSQVKEIRFTGKTEPKDLKMKVDKAEGFVDRGYRVKFVAMFKAKAGDEKKRLEEEQLINSVCSMVKNFAIIEQGPRVESRQAWVIFRHVKFAKTSSPKRKTQTISTNQIQQAS